MSGLAEVEPTPRAPIMAPSHASSIHRSSSDEALFWRETQRDLIEI
jgi:hypothetical protein